MLRNFVGCLCIAAGAILMVAAPASAIFCAPPSPPAQPGPRDKPRAVCDKCEQYCRRSPCYVASGIYVTDALDLQIPTAGFPITVSRRYESDRVVDGPLGLSWASSLTARVYFATFALASPSNYLYRAYVELPSGAEVVFERQPDGSFQPPLGVRHSLIRNGDGTWKFTPEKTRSAYLFNADGTLASMIDEFGNAIVFTYDGNGRLQSAADAAGSGRHIDIVWGPDGRISRVNDSSSRSLRYDYNADGTMKSFADPIVSSDLSQASAYYTYQPGRFGPVLSRVEDRWHRLITRLDWYPAGEVKSYTEGDFNDANPESSPGEKYIYTYFPAATPRPFTNKQDSLGSRPYYYDSLGIVNDQETYVAGRLTSSFDDFGQTDYTYNAQNNVATRTLYSQTHALFGQWTYTYDPVFPDKIASVTSSDPAQWSGWRYEYYQPGETAPGALKTVRRVRQDNSTLDVMSSYLYNSRGLVTSAATGYGLGSLTTTYGYNAAGEATDIVEPTGTTIRAFDGMGRLTSVTDPAGRTTTYTYDALDRIKTVTLPKPSPSSPLDFTTSYNYDVFDAATGLVFTEVTDPNGRVTRTGTDALGHVVQSVDALANVTTYTYQYNLLKSIRDANGNVTTYDYDGLRHLRLTRFPDDDATRPIVETYESATNGTLRSVTQRNGVKGIYAYDPAGRFLGVTYTSAAGSYLSSNAYTYTGEMLTEAVSSSPTISTVTDFTYDPAWRLETEQRFGGHKITYSYRTNYSVLFPIDSYRVDPPSGTTEPSQTVTYDYVVGNRVAFIMWSYIPGYFSIQYLAGGEIGSIAFPNGQSRQFTYDGQGRLGSVSNYYQNGVMASFTYGYDFDWGTSAYTMKGQRTNVDAAGVPEVQQTFGRTKYFYDANYQLTRADYGNGAWSETFTYDAIGNRLRHVWHGGTYDSVYYRYPSNPNANSSRLKSEMSVNLTYDANGNVANYGGSPLTWDAAGRLIGSPAGTTVYDDQGRRASLTSGTSVTTFVNRGLDVIATRNPSTGAKDDYLFGPGIDMPLAKRDATGAITYYLADGLGSIIATTNSAGTVTGTASYEAFGYALTSTVGLFGYTARENGPYGYFYRARYYDPARGRFLSEDPIQEFLPIVGGGVYGYVSNNPTNYDDPLGMQQCTLQMRYGTPNVETDSSEDWTLTGVSFYPNLGVGRSITPLTAITRSIFTIIRQECTWTKFFRATTYLRQKWSLLEVCTCPDSRRTIGGGVDQRVLGEYKSRGGIATTFGSLSLRGFTPCPKPRS